MKAIDKVILDIDLLISGIDGTMHEYADDCDWQSYNEMNQYKNGLLRAKSIIKQYFKVDESGVL